MYFPFLRGKQFELIALREIAKTITGSNTINPIIEPVKKKTSTYQKTLETLCQGNINFTVIINPSVGDKISVISLRTSFQVSPWSVMSLEEYVKNKPFLDKLEHDLETLKETGQRTRLSPYTIFV